MEPGRRDGAVVSLEVPEAVRAFVRSAGADDWLAGLPELVERLRRDWSSTGRTNGRNH